MIKVKTLRWGDYPGLPQGAQGILISERGRQEGQRSDKVADTDQGVWVF